MPVDTAASIASQGAVVPWARGHVLGRAMTARVMVDGFAAGAEVACLQRSAIGRPLYESVRVVETWTSFT